MKSINDIEFIKMTIEEAGFAGNPMLNLNALESLDADSARELAKWGQCKSGERTIWLENLKSLNVDAARALSCWGLWSTGHNYLFIGDISTFTIATLRALHKFSERDNCTLHICHQEMS